VPVEVRRLESEVSNLSEGRLATHPPVAMRTFVGKAMQSRLDNFAQSGSVGAQSFNYVRFGLPQGSYLLGTRMGRPDTRTVSSRHGAADPLSYHNLLKSKVDFGLLGMTGQAGWGAAVLNDRLEEDVGRLLAELRLGTTAVDMN